MGRTNQKERSVKYWKSKFYEANNKLIVLQSVKRTEGWNSVTRDAIKWGALFGIAYLFITSGSAVEIAALLAGEDTRLQLSAGIEINKTLINDNLIYLLVVPLMASIVANIIQKRTINKYIKKYAPIRAKLEVNEFQHRSSSELNIDGSTREENR